MEPPPSLPRRNIELKARMPDLAAARRTAEAMASGYLGVQRQVDTYFHCRHGRLKLREIGESAAQLVAYSRPDSAAAKASDYCLIDVSDAPALKQALAAALGVRLAVEKRREIFLAGNVRIHLDEVAGLGCFLEFEAVLGPDIDDAAGHAQLNELCARFGIRPEDQLAGSYADLLAAAKSGR